MDHVLGQFDQICDERSQMIEYGIFRNFHQKIEGCASNQACATNWNYTVI